MARWYGAALTTGSTVEAVQTWPDRIRAVTADAVNAAAKAWLDKRRSVTGYLIKDAATRGKAIVIRRLRCLIAAAAVLIAAVAAPQPRARPRSQRVVSPGGIEAWLVHEPSLPLVAMNFAFVGGATQDPADKPGVGYMVSSLLDDGAGELDAKAFQQRLEENAVELRFSVTHGLFLRLDPAAARPPGPELRPAAARAQPAALRRRRDRPRARADPGRAAARDHRPGQHRQPGVVAHRLSGSSLRASDRRHARHRSRPSPPTTCGPMRARCSRATPSRSPRSATSTRRRSARRSIACSARCPRPARASRCRTRRCATAAGGS